MMSTKELKILLSLPIIFASLRSYVCEFGKLNGTITWSTRLGSLVGTCFSIDDNFVYKFKQIPYAKPPIGNLRFRDPQMADPWPGKFNATNYGPSCVQMFFPFDKPYIPNLNATEDCLQLNIFVPRKMVKEQRLATMVWVHGGGFTNGQATMFDGSMLALRGNVIVVTINYRLNVFGFFAAGDVKGNLGIYDQQMAFKWVKENIADYGGDPDSITIFGESAGATSVTLHSILPSNLNLFHRVIAESGSMVSNTHEILSTDYTRAISFQIAKKLQCINESNEVDTYCLQSKSSQDVFDAYLSVPEAGYGLGIVGDNDLIPENIMHQLSDSTSAVYNMLQSIDLMAGLNSGEASLMYFAIKMLGINDTDYISSRLFCEKIIPLMMESFIENCTAISKTICEMYTPHGSNTSLAMQSQLATNFITDVMVLAPTELLLNYHVTGSSHQTYQYYFTHIASYDQITIPKPKWLTGATHGSEVTFVFGMDWYPTNITISEEERNLSNRMIDYWTNFAKFGNPYNSSSPGLTHWAPYTSSMKAYLQLDVTDSLGLNLRKEETSILNYQIPQMIQSCREENNYAIISTSSGKLKGKSVVYNRETTFHFKQIPYAQPPVDTLRFAKPIHHEPWSYIRNAQSFGPSCYQDDINVSEDCLHLNVFVPRSLTESNKRPVMIWIHGGGFTHGHVYDIDGSVLALFGDVIVVTIKYRLNVFGFFSLNRTSVKGNYGLYDQQFAVQWVKNNIARFGGDPNNITLFGESAGSVSTTLHALIPSNKGLFRRVIGESSSSLGRQVFKSKTFETSELILENLGCSSPSDDKVYSCLRSKDSLSLLHAYTKATDNVLSEFTVNKEIGPVVDGELIPAYPFDSLKNRSSDMSIMFSSVDVLVGTNSGDGGLLYYKIESRDKEFNFNSSVGIPTKVLCNNITPAIAKDIFRNCPGISNAICKKYTPCSPYATLQEQSEMAEDLYGDLHIESPTVSFLELHSVLNSTRSYQYLFARRPRWELTSPRPSWLVGANHASEIVFVFGLLKQWYPKSVPVMDDEVKLSNRMMTYWTNFAKNGNPNPNGDKRKFWPEYEVTSRNYLTIDIDDHVNSSLHNSRMKFWNNDIPNLMAKCIEL